MRRAYFYELCPLNPYDVFRFKRFTSTNRKYLTEQELQRIESYQPLTESLSNVKDMFLFSYFTGLAYIDLSQFDWSKAELYDGLYRLEGTRQKKSSI